MRTTTIAQAAEHSAQSIAVTNIADVYGDGEKIAAAMLTYPKEIDAHIVSAQGFAVEGFPRRQPYYTWSFAYNIEPIRDWLFRQTSSNEHTAKSCRQKIKHERKNRR